jgi:hypothetical protein
MECLASRRADEQAQVFQQTTDLVLQIALHLDQQRAAHQKRTQCMTIEPLDCMIRAMPKASLRSLLLICIFKAAFACLASMQITGSSILLSSVLSHVDVAPVSSPMRATWGALRFDECRDCLWVRCDRPFPHDLSCPIYDADRCNGALSRTRRVAEADMLPSIYSRSHEVDLVHFRTDSQRPVLARSRALRLQH